MRGLHSGRCAPDGAAAQWPQGCPGEQKEPGSGTDASSPEPGWPSVPTGRYEHEGSRKTHQQATTNQEASGAAQHPSKWLTLPVVSWQPRIQLVIITDYVTVLIKECGAMQGSAGLGQVGWNSGSETRQPVPHLSEPCFPPLPGRPVAPPKEGPGAQQRGGRPCSMPAHSNHLEVHASSWGRWAGDAS